MFALTFFLGGCGGDLTPEEQLRSALDSMELAAEDRNLEELMEYVSVNYVDIENRDHKQIQKIAQLYLLQNRKIHIYQHVTQLNVGEPFANAVIYVAVAGNPIPSPESLGSIRADLVRFKIQFEYEDSWKVVSAQWQRASAAEFL